MRGSGGSIRIVASAQPRSPRSTGFRQTSGVPFGHQQMASGRWTSSTAMPASLSSPTSERQAERERLPGSLGQESGCAFTVTRSPATSSAKESRKKAATTSPPNCRHSEVDRCIDANQGGRLAAPFVLPLAARCTDPVSRIGIRSSLSDSGFIAFIIVAGARNE